MFTRAILHAICKITPCLSLAYRHVTIRQNGLRFYGQTEQRQQIRSAEYTQFFRPLTAPQVSVAPDISVTQLNRGFKLMLFLLLLVYYNLQFIAVSLHAVPSIMPTARATLRLT